MTDHTPPQDIAAERAVLGAMLESPNAIADVVPLLTGREFYEPRHQTIYAAILAVYKQGSRPDPVTVVDQLRRSNDLGRVGGDNYVADLYTNRFTVAANAEHYAEILLGKHSLRQLAEAAVTIAQLAHSGVSGPDLDGALDRARALVDRATAGYRTRGHEDGAAIGDLALAALDRYAEPVPPGLPSGWHDLDFMLQGGLKPGQLCVVGARPGIGKSMLGINWATEAARRGVGALLCSMEMSRDEVTDRILASLATVELSNLTKHQLSEDDWARVSRWATELHSTPLWIEDTPNLSLSKIRSLARDYTRKPGGVGLVVADYMQLMRSESPREANREQQVAEFSRGLKLLAKELKAPVVALAQLNREVEKRAEPRPVIADLRESGAIEQDADVILLLWKDPQRQGEAQVVVAKNRQGQTGELSLGYSPHYARMRSLRAS